MKRVGPIQTRSWKKVAIPGLGECDAEEWMLEKEGQSQRLLLEISAKITGDAAAADAFAKKLNDFMEAKGLVQDSKAETKTRIVFNFFLGGG